MYACVTFLSWSSAALTWEQVSTVLAAPGTHTHVREYVHTSEAVLIADRRKACFNKLLWIRNWQRSWSNVSPWLLFSGCLSPWRAQRLSSPARVHVHGSGKLWKPTAEERKEGRQLLRFGICSPPPGIKPFFFSSFINKTFKPEKSLHWSEMMWLDGFVWIKCPRVF